MREFLILTCIVFFVVQTSKKAREKCRDMCTETHSGRESVVCFGLNGCATLMKFFVYFVAVLIRDGLLHCQGTVDDGENVQERPRNSYSC